MTDEAISLSGSMKRFRKVADKNINAMDANSYYEKAAYRSGAIPSQGDQHEELHRSKLGRSASPVSDSRGVTPEMFSHQAS